MAMPNLKDYLIPECREELSSALSKYGDAAMILGGGTFLHGLKVRHHLPHVEALIDIQRLGLENIVANNWKIHIGAGSRLGALAAITEIRGNRAYQAILDALMHIPSQVKNTATIGGCVAASSPLFDLPPVLAALDCTVGLRRNDAERSLAITDFQTGMCSNALERGEYVECIELPSKPKQSASAFMKLDDQILINVAVYLSVDETGNYKDARIVVGGEVGATIVRAHAAEQLLTGEKTADSLFESASNAITDDVNPFSDHCGSSDYRRAMVNIYVNRCLEKAQQRLKAKSE